MIVTKVDSAPAIRCFHVLGVRIHCLEIPDIIRTIESWIAARDKTRYVAVTNVHVVTETLHDEGFRAVLNEADLCVPDGMPLVWVARRQGETLRRRAYGPELMLEFCRHTHQKGYRHFFYGSRPGIPEVLAERLQQQSPGLVVAGTYSPPFRPLTPEEDAREIEMINAAAPDVLWVGLGCPKQERWMYDHRTRLRVPAVIAVGQAFDVHAGALRQAPEWMREHGLEWAFRLCLEPRRLWRRYLVRNSQFILALFREWLAGAHEDHR